MRLLILSILTFEVLNVCPNYCSGHGICSEDDVCTCFKAPGLDTSYFSHPQYVGSCPYGESFAVITNQKYDANEVENAETDYNENSRFLEEFSNFEVSLMDIPNYEIIELEGSYPLLGNAGGIMNCNRFSEDTTRSCQLTNLNVVARQENKYLVHWPEEESMTCNGTLVDSLLNPILQEEEYLYNCEVIYKRKDLSTLISSKINGIHNNNVGIMEIDGISQLLEYYNYNDNESYNLGCIYKEDTLQMKIYPAILYLYSKIEEKDNTTDEGDNDNDYNSTTETDGNEVEYSLSENNRDNNNYNNVKTPYLAAADVELPGSFVPPTSTSTSSSSSSSSPFLNNLMKKQQQQKQNMNVNNKRFLKEKLFENKIKSLSSIFNKPPPPTNYDFDNINNNNNRRKLSEENNNNNNNNNNNIDEKQTKFQKYLKLIDNEIVSGNNAIFVTTEPILPEGQCFLLGNTKGENITIDKSELMKYLRYENNKYYFGPNVNPNNAFSKIINGSSIDYMENSEIEIDDKEFIERNGIIFELSQLFSHEQFKTSLIQLSSSFDSKMTVTYLSPSNGIYMKIYTIKKVKFYNIDGEELDNEGNIINENNNNNKPTVKPTTDIGNPTGTDSENNEENNLNNNRVLQQQQQQQRRMLPNEIYVAIITEPPFHLIDEETYLFFEIQSNTVHEFVECSGAGLCNRNSGKCECFSGYEGIACQRMKCPNDCSNHGKCVTYNEAIKGSNFKNQIKQKFGYSGSNSLNEKFFGCLCESGYRGSDCSMKECPSYEDPQTDKDIKKNGVDGEYRDCSGRGICNYDIGVCECFNGYSGAGCEIIMPTNY